METVTPTPNMEQHTTEVNAESASKGELPVAEEDILKKKHNICGGRGSFHDSPSSTPRGKLKVSVLAKPKPLAVGGDNQSELVVLKATISVWHLHAQDRWRTVKLNVLQGEVGRAWAALRVTRNRAVARGEKDLQRRWLHAWSRASRLSAAGGWTRVGGPSNSPADRLVSPRPGQPLSADVPRTAWAALQQLEAERDRLQWSIAGIRGKLEERITGSAHADFDEKGFVTNGGASELHLQDRSPSPERRLRGPLSVKHGLGGEPSEFVKQDSPGSPLRGFPPPQPDNGRPQRREDAEVPIVGMPPLWQEHTRSLTAQGVVNRPPPSQGSTNLLRAPALGSVSQN